MIINLIIKSKRKPPSSSRTVYGTFGTCRKINPKTRHTHTKHTSATATWCGAFVCAAVAKQLAYDTFLRCVTPEHCSNKMSPVRLFFLIQLQFSETELVIDPLPAAEAPLPPNVARIRSAMTAWVRSPCTFPVSRIMKRIFEYRRYTSDPLFTETRVENLPLLASSPTAGHSFVL